jgi:antitoxin (DNA-binding transcriptional repressor) of toxin-antitoxin stability system
MVEAGDDVILARNGTMVAKLIKWPETRVHRMPGALMGKVSYGDDIVGSDADVLALFDDIEHS